MKILIAYDGSEGADAALDDLRRAGLPETVEAVVLTVADVFLPPPINEETDNTFPLYVPDGIRRAHKKAALEIERAAELAARAGERIKTLFPGWDVRTEACGDSPAWAVIKMADGLKPDLIIVGSHGHTFLGDRLILGSVSQRILQESSMTVRVSRHSNKSADSPVRILIGTDGSPDAEAAVEAVTRRVWPGGSEARVLCVLDTVMFVTPDPSQPPVMKWVEDDDRKKPERVGQVFEPLAEKLRTAGLNASVITMEGNPKLLIIEEAKEWNADSIFVGAKGVRGIDRFLLGSVSAAVAARAHCSVEVVRSR